MSKLSASSVRGFINTLLSASSLEDGKKRNFVETIELQIGLKNYDPQRDKRCVPLLREDDGPCCWTLPALASMARG
jgi:ribosomal protein L1